MENEIKFKDYPIFMWLLGFGAAAYSAYYLVFNFASPFWLNAAIGLIVGFLLLILSYGLTITADKQMRILTLDYRSLILHSVKEIPFDNIAFLRIDSRVSYGSRRGRTATYCILAELKNGDVIPFRSYYSGGSFSKQKIVDGLRPFIGLPETLDATPQGIFRAAPKIGAMVAQAQQQALADSNEEMRVTDGVHWQMQPIGIGASPAMRWFSPDFKTRGGFLFLAQKVAGQSASGFMATVSTVLFKQSISLYGFSASDTPNIAQAELYAGLSPALDMHFMAFTSDPTEARELLNPWMQNPLAVWGARYPLKQFQSGATGYSQIVVLYSPNGVYIATTTMLNPDEVNEIAALGVEMVKSQGR